LVKIEVSDLIEGLLDAQAYPHPSRQIRLIETHISYVFLTGDFAYKLKKPVHLPFVDFSTLELRRRSCDDEVTLNRRLAEEIYLEVVPIGGTVREPRVGATPAIEYAVKMVQFSPSMTLDRLIDDGQIQPQAITALAERIAAFHDDLNPLYDQAGEDAVLANLQSLSAAIDATRRQRLKTVASWLQEQSRRLEPQRLQRRRGGFIRECHGDLHLGNLLWIDGRILPFDCIEFSLALRSIDTLDEVAFLVMDLMAHSRTDLAFEFLNRYLEKSGDYRGVCLLRYFMVHRALVRSYVHVLASKSGNTSELDPYLGLANELTKEQAPILFITHGFSGSGKTTVTDALIGRIPGIRVRSDLVRKRLCGLQPGERSDSGIGTGLYTRSTSDATYRALADFAGIALEAGFDVIVDAAFLERARRRVFAAVAQRHEAGFCVLSMTADEALLRQRITQRQARGSDASEADTAVLEYQLQYAEPISEDEHGIVISVDTGGPVEADQLVKRIRSRLADRDVR
jgi:hypothetical protein